MAEYSNLHITTECFRHTFSFSYEELEQFGLTSAKEEYMMEKANKILGVLGYSMEGYDAVFDLLGLPNSPATLIISVPK